VRLEELGLVVHPEYRFRGGSHAGNLVVPASLP
jgi:hypothetical protein